MRRRRELRLHGGVSASFRARVRLVLTSLLLRDMSAALLCFRGSGADDVFEYERLGRFSTGSTIVLCSPWGFEVGVCWFRWGLVRPRCFAMLRCDDRRSWLAGVLG